MIKIVRMLGVTLLEIMLVLAVAAVIIVSSVRYYQSAVANSQVSAAFEQMQTIAATAATLAQRTYTYTNVVDTAAVKALMPHQSMTSPWGGDITIIGTATEHTFNVRFSQTPAKICPLLKATLSNNENYDASATTCGSTANNFDYTYNALP